MVTRTSELKHLEQIYGTSGNQFVFVYGRKGCDKELLFKLFTHDKKSFYYRCRQCSDDKQLGYLMNEVSSKFSTNFSIASYDECFKKVKSGNPTKLVVIIDEIQFAGKNSSGLIDSLLKLKAKKLYPGPVMIIVASSSLVWGENGFNTLMGENIKKVDYKIKLSDVTFLDIVRTFPEYSVAQCVSTYGIIGGVSSYLNRWNGKKSIKENVCTNILNPSGFLFNEAENFISSELRELSCYSTILASIAAGNEKLNDLYEDTGYSRAKISVYMKNLAEFDVIDKAVSFETGGWDNAKKGVYRINSPYVHFWYTFVYPHISDLYVMSTEEFYDAYIADGLDQYLQLYFANVCREYLQLLNMINKLPIKLTSIGTWIGKEGTIDVIGQSSNRENVVGICNWSAKTMPYSAYEELLASMKKAKISAKTIYLFSATAFDEKLIELEKESKMVVLVDMTEL